MRILSSLVFLVFVLTGGPPAHATTIDDVPNPRDRGVWVTDMAAVLSDADEEVINDAIDAIEEETGVEIALVTVDQVTAPSTKDFIIVFFNHWGVGKSDINNGLLIVLVMGERRLEMETGYGVEAVLTDGWLATMQAEKMVPHFKEGDFACGLVRGVNAVTGRLRAYAEELPQAADEARPKSTLARLADSNSDDTTGATRSGEDPPPPGTWCCCGILGLLLLWSIGRRKRSKRCPQCETKMEPMRDVEVDALLSPGHRLERAIKSRMFPFLKCPACNHVHDRPLNVQSAYKTCPECNFITLEVRVENLVDATTSSPGRRRIFENCLFCQHSSHHDETTPMVPRRAPSTTRTVIIRDDDDDDDDGGFFGSSYSSGGSSWSSDDDASSSGSSSWSAGSSSSGGRSSGSSRRKKSSGSFGGGRSGGGGAGSSW